MTSLVVRTILPAALVLIAALTAPPAAALEAAVSFSSRSDGDIPRVTGETEFTCSDTVYAIIETEDLAAGTHDIELQWFDPRGERQELTRFKAHSDGGATMIWAWMRLHGPDNSGLVRTFDPAHGMRDFIGQWTVKTYVDQRQVDTAHFDMLC